MLFSILDRNAKRPALSRMKPTQRDAPLNPHISSDSHFYSPDNTDPRSHDTSSQPERRDLAHEYIVGMSTPSENSWSTLPPSKTERIGQIRWLIIDDCNSSTETLPRRWNHPSWNKMRSST